MMIRLVVLVFATFAVVISAAHAQDQDVYTIGGIAVDEQAATVAEAQQLAIFGLSSQFGLIMMRTSRMYGI